MDHRKGDIQKLLSIRPKMRAQATEESYRVTDKLARFLVLDRSKSCRLVRSDDNGDWSEGSKDDMKGLLRGMTRPSRWWMSPSPTLGAELEARRPAIPAGVPRRPPMEPGNAAQFRFPPAPR